MVGQGAARALAVAVAAALAAVALAGCLGGTKAGDDGSDALGCCGPPEGDAAGPVAVEEFHPDLPRLKRDFCSNGTLELPAPRFGLVRYAGPEDRLYDGPMPCTVILDPASTEEQRNGTSVSIDVLEASAGGTGFTIESYSSLMLSDAGVYGGIDFTAPSGAWGKAGGYEVGYDPREEGGRIVATLARLDRAPR